MCLGNRSAQKRKEPFCCFFLNKISRICQHYCMRFKNYEFENLILFFMTYYFAKLNLTQNVEIGLWDKQIADPCASVAKSPFQSMGLIMWGLAVSPVCRSSPEEKSPRECMRSRLPPNSPSIASLITTIPKLNSIIQAFYPLQSLRSCHLPDGQLQTL